MCSLASNNNHIISRGYTNRGKIRSKRSMLFIVCKITHPSQFYECLTVVDLKTNYVFTVISVKHCLSTIPLLIPVFNKITLARTKKGP